MFHILSTYVFTYVLGLEFYFELESGVKIELNPVYRVFRNCLRTLPAIFDIENVDEYS